MNTIRISNDANRMVISAINNFVKNYNAAKYWSRRSGSVMTRDGETDLRSLCRSAISSKSPFVWFGKDGAVVPIPSKETVKRLLEYSKVIRREFNKTAVPYDITYKYGYWDTFWDDLDRFYYMYSRGYRVPTVDRDFLPDFLDGALRITNVPPLMSDIIQNTQG